MACRSFVPSERFLLDWVLPGKGKEHRKVRPSTRLSGPATPRLSFPKGRRRYLLEVPGADPADAEQRKPWDGILTPLDDGPPLARADLRP